MVEKSEDRLPFPFPFPPSFVSTYASQKWETSGFEASVALFIRYLKYISGGVCKNCK